MKLDEATTLYNYTQWAHRQVWGCIATLTDEQFTRDFDYSRGSIRNQFMHIVNVEEVWLARLLKLPRPQDYRAEDYPTRAEILTQWQEIETRWRSYLDTLTDDAMQEIIEFDAAGAARRNPRWTAITQVVNHGTDHRSQILALLWQLGAPTVEQDFPLYYWSLSAP